MEAVKKGKTAHFRGTALRATAGPGDRGEFRSGGVGMADVIFVALTIAIFVVLGLVVRAVERR
ncbi:hypothetical protein SAMN05421869_101310 [Nonomuraea jiangxiensis]|uniref:Uncharacterized protein n=1 Tax=Nonomuraea jiangxiensis TaxID=633440 RepID=A0A1G7Z4H1_9ACTN|nr:hypothetical protein SAMN05421869_101310 [Nonomuraea jiangxiensis]